MIIKEKQANLILLMLESEVSRKIRNEWRQISWSFSAFNTENVRNNNITTPGLKLLVFVTRIFASMGEITCDGQASITSCYRNSDKFCWMGLLFQNLTSYFFLSLSLFYAGCLLMISPHIFTNWKFATWAQTVLKGVGTMVGKEG